MSNGQIWYGTMGFAYKKNTGVGASKSTRFAPGGNAICNQPTYLFNKYKPGFDGVGAVTTANRVAKRRYATVCTKTSKCGNGNQPYFIPRAR